jgi:hypothetical protein
MSGPVRLHLTTAEVIEAEQVARVAALPTLSDATAARLLRHVLAGGRADGFRTDEVFPRHQRGAGQQVRQLVAAGYARVVGLVRGSELYAVTALGLELVARADRNTNSRR